MAIGHKRLGLGILILAAFSTAAARNADPRVIAAARNSDVDGLRALIKQGADINFKQGDGSTALHWAAYRDNLQSAQLLIEAGADVNAANELGATPLWAAAVNGSSAMVRELLKRGANPNAALTLGETVTMTAARTGNADVVEQLLAKGANPNAHAARGQTALMWAVEQAHPDVVKVLLAHGADVNAHTDVWRELVKTDPDQASHPDYQVWINQGGNSPLMFAARVGDVESAKLLIAAGANVNDKAAYGCTPVVLAAHSNFDRVVALLLDQGADPNASDAGYTALQAAILRNNEKAVTALLAHGANPNAPLRTATPVRRESEDYFFHNEFIGATPFWLAARFNEPNIMRLLQQHGANPKFVLNVEYPTGSYGTYSRVKEGPTTVLMAAVGMGGKINAGWQMSEPHEREALALEATKIAVDAGVDLNAANDDGDTALHGASARGYDSVVKYLTEKGADTTVKNKHGETPSEVPRPRSRRR